MNGQIIRMRADKGFGFIRCEDGQERFFHRTRCAETAPFEQLKEKDFVKFHLEEHEKGVRCVSVDLL